MTAALERGARQLLAGEHEGTSAELADRAARACERLAAHMSRLLGGTGVTLLVRRSISLAGTQHPWLVPALRSDDVIAGIREVMTARDADSIAIAFTSVLSAFVGLLQRLIGEELVKRLLEEVWPTVFTEPAKDTV